MTTQAPACSQDQTAADDVLPLNSWTARTQAGCCLVRTLDDEVGAADDAGQLRVLPRELELRREFLGNLHPLGQLEPDGPLRPVLKPVHHVDREPGLVEDIRKPDAPGDEAGRL